MKVDIPRYYQDAMYRHLVDTLHWGPESMTRETVLALATACLDAPNATERGLIVEIYKKANAPIIIRASGDEARETSLALLTRGHVGGKVGP